MNTPTTAQARQQSEADELGVYTTVLSKYSLEAGEVGKAIGEPVVTEYLTGEAALAALVKAITKGGFSRYLIGTPDGRQIPFDAAYTEIVGVAPVYSEGPTRYPHLKK